MSGFMSGFVRCIGFSLMGQAAAALPYAMQERQVPSWVVIAGGLIVALWAETRWLGAVDDA